MTDSPRAVVIGASSGIGAALAAALAGRGISVALVARREDRLQQIADKINDIAGRKLAWVHPADVTDFGAVPALFNRIVGDLGGLDMVVYASGIMPKIGPNEYSFDKDRQIVEVNVLGAMAWLNLAAERFEKQRGGTIIGISSVAADRGRRGTPVYNTSKAALDTYLEALRNRLSRYGVHVLTIKPGFVETDMIAGLKLPPFPKPISADEAARQTLHALDNHEQVRYVPGIWRFVGFVIRNLPSPIMQKISF
jgi:short-subunit dehydrogenase